MFCVLVFYLFSDSSGVDVTKSQDTPVAIKREDPYIVFDVDVEIQKPLEKMPKGKVLILQTHNMYSITVEGIAWGGGADLKGVYGNVQPSRPPFHAFTAIQKTPVIHKTLVEAQSRHLKEKCNFLLPKSIILRKYFNFRL